MNPVERAPTRGALARDSLRGSHGRGIENCGWVEQQPRRLHSGVGSPHPEVTRHKDQPAGASYFRKWGRFLLEAPGDFDFTVRSATRTPAVAPVPCQEGHSCRTPHHHTVCHGPLRSVRSLRIDIDLARLPKNKKQMGRFASTRVWTRTCGKDDRRDAFVLAASLRTDRPAFRRVRLDDPVIIFAPATVNRSRKRSNCFGLRAYTWQPRSTRVSTRAPRGTSMATLT